MGKQPRRLARGEQRRGTVGGLGLQQVRKRQGGERESHHILHGKDAFLRLGFVVRPAA